MVTHRRPFKNPTLWMVLGLLLAASGISAVAIRSVLQARQAEQAASEQPLPQRVSVAALGRIEPKGRVIDVAASENGVLAQLLVTEGEQVNQGQPLAYLDMYEVRKAERDYAASQLNQARDKLAAETQLGSAQIQAAGTRVDQVDMPQTEAIRAQRASIDSLQAQLDLAQLDLGRIRDL
ncbi:MAG: biotin/lipoyl-binding protein, partial [Leptolyngbya sp. SIO4C1]|nr:biotin/lipoyl-binding protein [Leptolyngbya sp. SIO4C1]